MNRYLLALVLLIIFLMSACEELTFDNPFDSDTELASDDWTPTNLTVVILTDSQVQLSWQSSESQIDGFKVERKDSANGAFSEVASSDTTNYTDTGLITGSEYTYRVCAYSGDNKSSYVTSEIIVTTFPAPYNMSTVPKIDNKIEVTWADSTTYESGFVIERKKISSSTFTVIDSIVQNTYQDTVITLGNQYVYKVGAYSDYNTSSYTDTASVKYWQDCSDIWGGTDVEDNCGTCDSDSSNDCDIDCDGNWGGVLANDNCGVCEGDNSPLTGSCDCHGTPNGKAYTDGCGACVGGLTGSTACANDCLGVLEGDAVYDNCNTCDDDPENDCLQDCAGTWGGDLVDDECGVCGGDNSPSTGTCDCASTPNGTAVEDCAGVCGGTSVLSGCDNACNSTAVEDCAGVCGGSAVVDECGVCGGDGIDVDACDCAGNVEDCAGVCGGTSVLSGCDNACNSTAVEDCAGVCGGSAVVDECGVCDGDGIADDACDCDGNTEDCAGECEGSATTDNCGGCVGGTTGASACEQDCNGEWGGTAIDGSYCDSRLLVPSEYSTIQSAINVANAGDSVFVSAGTYIENINFNGKNISVIGAHRETTSIDGNQNGSVVVFENGEASTTLLKGFTIKNGSGNNIVAQGDEWPAGGGILILNNSSPQIVDCIIKGNHASQGGAVFSRGASASIRKCIITDNSAGIIPAIACTTNVQVEIINCIIYNNDGSNEYPYIGWGMKIINTIIFEENPIPSSPSGFPTIMGSISYSNIFLPNYQSFVLSVEGTGVIYSDPSFNDPENGDFTLQSDSPCIDAGNPSSEYNDADGSRNDMGAYGGPSGN